MRIEIELNTDEIASDTSKIDAIELIDSLIKEHELEFNDICDYLDRSIAVDQLVEYIEHDKFSLNRLLSLIDKNTVEEYLGYEENAISGEKMKPIIEQLDRLIKAYELVGISPVEIKNIRICLIAMVGGKGSVYSD